LAKPYVSRRLNVIERALTQEPFRAAETNKALKEAVSRIVINPETAELTLYWHHAPEQPTEGGPVCHATTPGLTSQRMTRERHLMLISLVALLSLGLRER
jgi:hypothetical protein